MMNPFSVSVGVVSGRMATDRRPARRTLRILGWRSRAVRVGLGSPTYFGRGFFISRRSPKYGPVPKNWSFFFLAVHPGRNYDRAVRKTTHPMGFREELNEFPKGPTRRLSGVSPQFAMQSAQFNKGRYPWNRRSLFIGFVSLSSRWRDGFIKIDNSQLRHNPLDEGWSKPH